MKFLDHFSWANRRVFFVLLPVAVVCGSLWIFAGVTEAVHEGQWQEAENAFIRSLRTPQDASVPVGPAWLHNVCLDISALGGGAVLTLMSVLVIGYLLLLRHYHAILLLLAAALGGMGLNSFLKRFFGRERPDIVPHLSDVASASYPSGHSMLSAIVYLTLGVMLAQAVKPWSLKVYFVGAALLLSFLIGLTRIYLGVHYPTDVVGGWTVGTAYAVFCAMVASWLQQRGVVEPEE